MRRLRGSITVLAMLGGLAVLVPAAPAVAANPPTIAIGDGAGDESVGGKPGQIRLPVTLSDPSTSTVTVDWTFAPTGQPGGATAADVVKTSGTVTFKPSARTGLTATTKYVTVRAVPDTQLEGSETFEVRLTNPSSGNVLARATGTGTVLDPATGTTITAHDAAIVEGDTGVKNPLKVLLTLATPQPAPVTVDVSVAGGTATPDSDYKAVKPRTITFNAGQTRKNVTIAVTPDVVDEPGETITLALTNPTGGATIAIPTATASIRDDDGAPPPAGLVVDTAADTHDAAPGNGVCADSSGACSLRAAVDELNAAPPTPAVIELAASPELSILGANDDINVSGDIDIRVSGVEIRGHGHRIDANGIDRVVHVLAGGFFRLVDVTIAGGDVPLSTDAQPTVIGGGVYAPTSSVSITDSRVLGNLARREVCPPGCTSSQWRGSGGGVAALSVDVADSLIGDNQAASEGGGIWSGGTVTVHRSTVWFNAATTPAPCGCVQQGGGIRSAAVTIVDSTLDRNSSDGAGGAAYVGQSNLTVQRSAVTNNTAANVGGLYAFGTGGTVADSTFSGNAGGALGLAVLNTTGATVSRSTFVDNPGASAIWFAGVACPSPSPGCNPSLPAILAIDRTIVRPTAGEVACTLGNQFLPDLQIAVDGGSNLIADRGDCMFGSPADPLLGPLADNGGPTLTHLPQAGSPAVDGGGACTGVDQRGVARPQGTACDIGAVEVVPSTGMIVNTSADSRDASPGDGACRDAAGRCSLRAAVDEVNVGSGPRVIALAADPMLAITGVGEDLNATGDIDVRVANVEIRGNGHTIDADGIDRVLQAHASATGMKVVDATITGGDVTATVGNGGGILARSLTIERSTIVDNAAVSGAGIAAVGELAIIDSSIASNRASTALLSGAGSGGGVWVDGPVRITRSTMTDNRATGGGALYASSPGLAVIEQSTFSANHAIVGAALALQQVYNAYGAQITGSTLVGNQGGASIEFTAPTCAFGPGCPPPPGVLTITRSVIAPGSFSACATGNLFQPSVQSIVDGGSNLISNGGACTFGSTADALLGPLADNGGPTWTHLPQPASPAIDGGGTCTGTDQRGVSRPKGLACDIGAVEIES